MKFELKPIVHITTIKNHFKGQYQIELHNIGEIMFSEYRNDSYLPFGIGFDSIEDYKSDVEFDESDENAKYKMMIAEMLNDAFPNVNEIIVDCYCY